MTYPEAAEPVVIRLSGRIDSHNSAQAEEELLARLSGRGTAPVVLDAQDLEYISSAGLRVILRLKKNRPDFKIKNVSSEIYEILEMTGFTEMMTVEKAFRVVSVDGCEEIGRGSNGTIYRTDRDTVVKVYHNADALEDIRHEREMARLALILGVPTAISYDVVRVGESYGSVFELLNARSFAEILTEDPEKMDWCVKEFTDMLKLIHSTTVPEGKLPSAKAEALSRAEFLTDHLPAEASEKLISLIRAVPDDDHMIHGDYHTENLVLQNGEVLLIDMDTLSTGHPVFELASMYNAFVGFSEYDHEQIRRFQGFDYRTSRIFWHKTLEAYLGTDNEEELTEIENKARIVGYSRLIRRSIRRGETETEKGRSEVELWTAELLELLSKTDSLYFERRENAQGSENELNIEAAAENLDQVMDFVTRKLEAVECPPKASMHIELAVEEIFINIARYAYAPGRGRATVRVDVSGEPVTVTITFIDRGVPYDPLAKEDPDLTIPAEDRPVGGLGIFLTKNIMDDVVYEYKDGQNILTLKKNLS